LRTARLKWLLLTRFLHGYLYQQRLNTWPIHRRSRSRHPSVYDS
jgi:hypothetical protein